MQNYTRSRESRDRLLVPHRGNSFYIYLLIIETAFVGHPALYLMFNGFFFRRGIKRSRCEPNHSPPSITKFQSEWKYTSITHIRICPSQWLILFSLYFNIRLLSRSGHSCFIDPPPLVACRGSMYH